MPLGNASYLGDDHLTRWLVENSPIKIPFLQAWVWQSASGNPLEYARAAALAQARVVSDCGVVAEQEPTISQASFNLDEYATRYSICSLDMDTYQYPNQPLRLADWEALLSRFGTPWMGSQSHVGQLRLLKNDQNHNGNNGVARVISSLRS